jgi:hypothetical protein
MRSMSKPACRLVFICVESWSRGVHQCITGSIDSLEFRGSRNHGRTWSDWSVGLYNDLGGWLAFQELGSHLEFRFDGLRYPQDTLIRVC